MTDCAAAMDQHVKRMVGPWPEGHAPHPDTGAIKI